MIENDRN